jgi:SAM-dependent methyltransferase
VLPKRKFDAITLFQLLEHVEDPIAYLKELKAYLNPGGLLIVGVPNSAGPLRHFPEALTDIPPHHVTRWTEHTMRRAADRIGFRALAIKTESLPHYLFDAYIPRMWDDHIWPRYVMDAIGALIGMERDTRIHLLQAVLRKSRIRQLPGVPGLCLYTLLRNI